MRLPRTAISRAAANMTYALRCSSNKKNAWKTKKPCIYESVFDQLSPQVPAQTVGRLDWDTCLCMLEVEQCCATRYACLSPHRA
jgi:hypothetical protein